MFKNLIFLDDNVIIFYFQLFDTLLVITFIYLFLLFPLLPFYKYLEEINKVIDYNRDINEDLTEFRQKEFEEGQTYLI